MLQNAYYLRTQHNLDVVDAVVTSLTKANLTNASDKLMVASEDSSALAAIQNLAPSVKLVYNVPYNPDSPISVTSSVLQVSTFPSRFEYINLAFFWLQTP